MSTFLLQIRDNSGAVSKHCNTIPFDIGNPLLSLFLKNTVKQTSVRAPKETRFVMVVNRKKDVFRSL